MTAKNLFPIFSHFLSYSTRISLFFLFFSLSFFPLLFFMLQIFFTLKGLEEKRVQVIYGRGRCEFWISIKQEALLIFLLHDLLTGLLT
jgi:hypothetical protein